jgi:hypothetical protein
MNLSATTPRISLPDAEAERAFVAGRRDVPFQKAADGPPRDMKKARRFRSGLSHQALASRGPDRSGVGGITAWEWSRCS